MERIRPLQAPYRELFRRFVLADSELVREQSLMDAGELGKRALTHGPALDQMVALHQLTQTDLADQWRDAPAGAPEHAARERLARGEATPLMLALMLPHELAQLIHHESRWQRDHDTLAAMFEQTEQLIVVLDADGLIDDVNPAFVRATGWSPMEAAMSSAQVWTLPPAPPADSPGSGSPDGGLRRCEQPRSDGSRFTAEWSISPIRGRQGSVIGQVCIGRDVTRAQQIEEGLRENDKLRAVATLAGGIAHDFNNLLGSIIGLTELCLLEAPEGTRLARNLGRIGQAGDKAAQLVRQMLDFSRRRPATLQTVDAGEWLQTAQPLLQAAVLGRAKLLAVVRANGPVRLDPVQMEQVLLNLVRNAADAIAQSRADDRPGQPSGLVQTVLEYAEPPGHHAGSGTRHLCLRVIDNGAGIDPQVLNKIFEPFFTTKPVGEGTGLGLAAVHGIVSSHGGQVHVTSQPGLGSTFSMYLPLVTDAADAVQVGAPNADKPVGASFMDAGAAFPAPSTEEETP